MQLVTSFCQPYLLYCTECLGLTVTQIRSINHTWQCAMSHSLFSIFQAQMWHFYVITLGICMIRGWPEKIGFTQVYDLWTMLSFPSYSLLCRTMNWLLEHSSVLLCMVACSFCIPVCLTFVVLLVVCACLFFVYSVFCLSFAVTWWRIKIYI